MLVFAFLFNFSQFVFWVYTACYTMGIANIFQMFDYLFEILLTLLYLNMISTETEKNCKYLSFLDLRICIRKIF